MTLLTQVRFLPRPLNREMADMQKYTCPHKHRRDFYVSEGYLRGHISLIIRGIHAPDIAMLKVQSRCKSSKYRAVEQWPARKAHNLEVVGSNPASATNTKNNNMRNKFTPHFKVSVLKSAVRVGGFTLLMSSIPLGVAVLIIAEIISIYEELV